MHQNHLEGFGSHRWLGLSHPEFLILYVWGEALEFTFLTDFLMRQMLMDRSPRFENHGFRTLLLDVRFRTAEEASSGSL